MTTTAVVKDFNVLEQISGRFVTRAPGAHTDFVTAIMHELGHVFACASRIDQNGKFIDAPAVYDLNVENAAGVPLIDLSPKERLLW